MKITVDRCTWYQCPFFCDDNCNAEYCWIAKRAIEYDKDGFPVWCPLLSGGVEIEMKKCLTMETK